MESIYFLLNETHNSYVKNSRPNIKCPTCRECLDRYTLEDGKVYLYCWLCGRTYSLLPGRALALVDVNIFTGVKNGNRPD